MQEKGPLTEREAQAFNQKAISHSVYSSGLGELEKSLWRRQEDDMWDRPAKESELGSIRYTSGLFLQYLDAYSCLPNSSSSAPNAILVQLITTVL